MCYQDPNSGHNFSNISYADDINMIAQKESYINCSYIVRESKKKEFNINRREYRMHGY